MSEITIEKAVPTDAAASMRLKREAWLDSYADDKHEVTREEDIFLHVVSYNDKAIGFYEHFGFEKTGVEFPEEYDDELQIRFLPEIEMVLRPKQ